VVLLLLVAVVRLCLAGPFTPVYTNIAVGGELRNFGYYVPGSYDPSTPTPLLFMFHGAGGNNSEASGGSAENGYYGWQTSADENGFIVLFPKKECCFGFNIWSLSSDSGDLDFVDAMIDWATTNYTIRATHVFMTGHSYGAYFSYCVARWRSDDIAAFAEHSGGLASIPVPTGPAPTPQLSGILLHAVDDGIVNYSGSQDLYDELLANGHNVYDDGIGDGIIEVDGWGPDNHRYRKVHNQTQWNFFMSQAPVIDDDGDDMPDSWEIVHGLNTSSNDSSADSDGDGANNYAEYIADTHPTNAASVFGLNIHAAANWPVSWVSSSNRVYSLWFATDLMDEDPWTPVTQMTNMPGTGGTMAYTSTTSVCGFYRASVSLNE
jgi:poly(3-hydroxybutyrate) depolymerase